MTRTKRMFVFAFLKEMILAIFWSTWVANLIERGVDLRHASLALAAFFLAMAAFEVPTGLFADRHGRKLSTLAGLAIMTAGFFANSFLFGSNEHVWISYIAFAAAGIGVTLVSGAYVAWLLALAKSDATEFNQDHFFLTLDLIGRVATISGAFIGVRLTMWNPSSMWVGIGIIGLAALLVGATLREVQPHSSVDTNGTSPKRLSFLVLCRSALKEIEKNPVVLAILAASLFFGIEQGVRNTIYQPFVVNLNRGSLMSLAYFQSILALSRLAGNLAYRYVFSKWNKGPRFVSIALLALAGAEGIAAFTNSYIVFLVPYAIAVFALGWYFPVRDSLLNHQLSEQTRATVLSIDSLVMYVASGIACIALYFALEPSLLSRSWIIGCVALSASAVAFWAGTRKTALRVAC